MDSTNTSLDDHTRQIITIEVGDISINEAYQLLDEVNTIIERKHNESNNLD